MTEPLFIMHHLVSDYVQQCAAFARYDYLTVYHKHLLVNIYVQLLLLVKEMTTQAGHTHTQTRRSLIRNKNNSSAV